MIFSVPLLKEIDGSTCKECYIKKNRKSLSKIRKKIFDFVLILITSVNQAILFAKNEKSANSTAR